MQFRPLKKSQLNQYTETIANLIEHKVGFFEMDSKIKNTLTTFNAVRNSLPPNILCGYEQLINLMVRLQQINKDDRVKASFSQDVYIVQLFLAFNSSLESACGATEIELNTCGFEEPVFSSSSKIDKQSLLNLFDSPVIHVLI